MKKPLTLIPFLAFALLMPPALMPQAAFADGIQTWSKISILKGGDKFESDAFYHDGVIPAEASGTSFI